MPVAGNRQPYGLLHGGASAVLAETLGSVLAALNVLPDRSPVGLELQLHPPPRRRRRLGDGHGAAGAPGPQHLDQRDRARRRPGPADLHGAVDVRAPGRAGCPPSTASTSRRGRAPSAADALAQVGLLHPRIGQQLVAGARQRRAPRSMT
jgi:hypothetical protein